MTFQRSSFAGWNLLLVSSFFLRIWQKNTLRVVKVIVRLIFELGTTVKTASGALSTIFIELKVQKRCGCGCAGAVHKCLVVRVRVTSFVLVRVRGCGRKIRLGCRCGRGCGREIWTARVGMVLTMKLCGGTFENDTELVTKVTQKVSEQLQFFYLKYRKKMRLLT